MTKKIPDMESTNPRYQGMTVGQVVRTIMKPQHQEAAETLKKLQDQADQKGDG